MLKIPLDSTVAQDSLTAKLTAPVTLMAVCLGPAFLYPCLYIVQLATDTLLGDQVILDHLLNVSKRDIWGLFWSDWASALVASYVLLLPILLAALAIRHRFGTSLWLSLPGLALAGGLLVSITVFSGSYLVVLVAAALLFSLPATWILSKCTS